MNRHRDTPPTAIETAALRALADSPGHYPSSLAYTLLDRGVLSCKHPRGRWKAQGAGRIGGAILRNLWVAGWVQREHIGAAYSNGWVLSSAGRQALDAATAAAPEGAAS